MLKRKLVNDLEGPWAAVDSNALQFLVQPESLCDFLESVWETTPRVLRASSERKAIFPELGRLRDLEHAAAGKRQLEFGVDLTAARYVDGVRETVDSEVADAAAIRGLLGEGCTIQWHQPQRTVDGLWRLVAAAEKQLGCLVGANAYLTPAGTQGLAPHYDDVELWVCQTEGSKRWRVYGPKSGYELPAVSSLDFDQASLGEPIIDTTLEVGDVLYMPRGTVHQAVAQTSTSCHITVSTFQGWALADFAVALIQELQRGQPASPFNSPTPPIPAPLRPGLPIGLLYAAGLQASAAESPVRDSEAAAGPATARRVASALRDLADRLDSDPKLTSLAADHMASDFMSSRAPPHPAQLPDRGPAPTINSQVQSMGKGYCRVMPCQPSGEVLDAYAGVSDFVKVVTCLRNRIERHMMPGAGEAAATDDSSSDEEGVAPAGAQRNGRNGADSPGGSEASGSESDSDPEGDGDISGSDLVFPASFARALAQLLGAEAPVPVKELRLRTKDDKLGLAYSLWEEGLVRTAPGGAGAKRARGAG